MGNQNITKNKIQNSKNKLITQKQFSNKKLKNVDKNIALKIKDYLLDMRKNLANSQFQTRKVYNSQCLVIVAAIYKSPQKEQTAIKNYKKFKRKQNSKRRS